MTYAPSRTIPDGTTPFWGREARLATTVARVWRSSGVDEALAVLDGEDEENLLETRWRWVDGDVESEPRLTSTQEERLRHGESVTFSIDAPGDIEMRYTLVPLRSPEGRLGAVEIQERLLHESLHAREILARAALTVGAVVTVSGALSLALGVFLVRNPVRRLVEKARKIGAGELAGEVRVSQPDELGELAREMNAMSEQLAATRERAEYEASERLSALEQLRHADRLTTIGKLASAIGHELGTPLAIVSGRAEILIETHPPGTPAHENASIILEQTERMTATLRQFLDFGRRRYSERARHDVRELLDQTLDFLKTLAERRGLKLAIVGNGAVEWNFDAFQIQQALTNVLVNAIQAAPPGGTVVSGYEVRPNPRSDSAESRFLHLYVRDEGSGMPPDVIGQIFEPFFTTKEVGEGTGLGLPIAQGIVRDHGGFMEATSEEGRGSTLSIWLPECEIS